MAAGQQLALEWLTSILLKLLLQDLAAELPQMKVQLKMRRDPDH